MSKMLFGVAIVCTFAFVVAVALSALHPVAATPTLQTSHSSSTATDQVTGPPTLTAAFIDQVLAAAHSPAHGLGTVIYRLGVQFGIDPAFALAFFHHESDYGRYGVAATTHSFGNIRCTPGVACFQGYRDYHTWQEGIQDWYRLIHDVYLANGLNTVTKIILVYAPPSDGNDVHSYIAAVIDDVEHWRYEEAGA